MFADFCAWWWRKVGYICHAVKHNFSVWIVTKSEPDETFGCETLSTCGGAHPDWVEWRRCSDEKSFRSLTLIWTPHMEPWDVTRIRPSNNAEAVRQNRRQIAIAVNGMAVAWSQPRPMVWVINFICVSCTYLQVRQKNCKKLVCPKPSVSISVEALYCAVSKASERLSWCSWRRGWLRNCQLLVCAFYLLFSWKRHLLWFWCKGDRKCENSQCNFGVTAYLYGICCSWTLLSWGI